MGNRWSFVVAALLALALAVPAAAKDSPQSVLDDAKILARQGSNLKAAERYGDAVALAHEDGDLQIEEAIAASLQEFIDDAERDALMRGAAPASPGQTNDAASLPNLLAAVMRSLDAGRCGAYVSAPVLARNVLLLATESGDFGLVAGAAAVASAHGSKAGSGRAAAVVAKYAEGMRAAADGKFAVAAPLLAAVATDAAKAGWLDLVSHAGTEAACAWVKAGSPDNAAASMKAVVASIGAAPDLNRINTWAAFAKKRLAGAPDSVTKPLTELVERSKGPNSVTASGGKGGKGGRGGNAGEEPVSDIGRLLPKMAKGKAFVRVHCTARGMEIEWATGADETPVRAFDEMVRIAGAGGVVLALQNRSVALMMLDLQGSRGEPGERSHASPVRAFYLLAEGETWGVSKAGVVTIAR